MYCSICVFSRCRGVWLRANQLPAKYVLRHWRTLVFLLGPVMLWSWMISALLIWALIPGLDFLNSLVVASCLSPTDPILAQAVVGGPWAEKHVPSHIRHMLQCESGCNDGAAFPFLFIAYYLTVNRGQVGFPVARWFYRACTLTRNMGMGNLSRHIYWCAHWLRGAQTNPFQ